MKLEGFFHNIKTANETVKQLKTAGFQDAVVDINDHYNDERNIETNQPGTEMGPSLSGLVLEGDAHVTDRSKAPLTAASPMVSGIAGFTEIADVKSRIIVDVPNGNENKARKIIESMGGSLDNPNVQKPHLPEHSDI